MDEQPIKRPGRPRKVVDVSPDAAQAESTADQHDGNGGNGEVGLATQAEPLRQSPWDAFVCRVIDKHNRNGRSFNKVSHPNPEASVIHGVWDIAVEVGDELI